jgi:hypothetical protein
MLRSVGLIFFSMFERSVAINDAELRWSHQPIEEGVSRLKV